LLHGFGFASGLSTVGMPKAEIPLALAMFNVGVELGQLTFVAPILLSCRAARILECRWPRSAALAPAYLIGSPGPTGPFSGRWSRPIGRSWRHIRSWHQTWCSI
jgi:hypothetical protein